jgi:hypothetical protein
VATGIERREVLLTGAHLLATLGLASSLPLALQGCSLPDEEALNQRIIRSLRSLMGDRDASGKLATESGMDVEDALRTLRADTSRSRLFAFTSNDFLMRTFVEARRNQDLRQRRTRFVDGWLLTQTEIAIAVLLGI